MTTEETKLFNDYLSENSKYYTFYECLEKVPIEQPYSTKNAYIMRAIPLLVLNYGFWQDRGYGRIKEADWRHLREGWIARAAEAGILGKAFIGIEPKNIISAINAEFNGRQFQGTLKDSDKYAMRIATRAAAIQDSRDYTLSAEANKEVDELNRIINDTTVRPSSEVYTAAALDQRTKICLKQMLEGAKYTGKKSIPLKRFNALMNAMQGGTVLAIEQEVEAVKSMCEDISILINKTKQRAQAEFKESMSEYERHYTQWQEKVRLAKERLDEIMREAEKPEQEESVMEPQPAVAQSEVQEEKIVLLRKSSAARRVSLLPTQMAVHCNQSKGSKKALYRITINSTISKQLKDGKLLFYNLVRRNNNIGLRFGTNGLAAQRISMISTGNSCSINDKPLVEYFCRHFGITSCTMIVDVNVEASDNTLLCEFTAATAVSFEEA